MRRATALVLALALSATGATAQGQEGEEELGEAQGLGPATGASAAPPSPGPVREDSALRWRANALVDWRWRHGADAAGVVATRPIGPNAQLGAAVDRAFTPKVSGFLEGRALYEDETEDTLGVLDQGGVRWRPADAWSLALGKERNRRSPGLIVSPSDFLHTSQGLPGLREERGGVWLGRASWQSQTQSADLIALPVSRMRASGLPDADAEWLGFAGRYFRRWEGIDLGLDVGTVDDELKAGAYVQTIAADVWKLYAETGHDGGTETQSQLAGIGYEGSGSYTVRGEWYWNGAPAVPGSLTLFPGRSYATFSASVVELLDRFNLTDTVIRSLEDRSFVNLVRGDWLLDDRNVVGATWIRVNGDRPFAWQLMIDWKASL